MYVSKPFKVHMATTKPQPAGIACPKCGGRDHKVLDSRGIDEAVRRRLHCEGCKTSFTTFEVVREKFNLLRGRTD